MRARTTLLLAKERVGAERRENNTFSVAQTRGNPAECVVWVGAESGRTSVPADSSAKANAYRARQLYLACWLDRLAGSRH